MAFIESTPLPIPEVSLADPEGFQRRFLEVLRLDLPGIVLRDFASSPNEVVRKMTDTISPVAKLGRPRSRTEDFGATRLYSTGLGLHIDAHDPGDPETTQLNIHASGRGLSTVSLFEPQPDFMDKLKAGTVNLAKDWGTEEWHTNHKVDEELFLPTVYTTELTPRSVLLWTDSRHGHDFEITEWPRSALARLYRPRIRQQQQHWWPRRRP